MLDDEFIFRGDHSLTWGRDGTGRAEIIEKSLKNEVEKLLLEISDRHDEAGSVKWFLTQLRFRAFLPWWGLAQRKFMGPSERLYRMHFPGQRISDDFCTLIFLLFTSQIVYTFDLEK